MYLRRVDLKPDSVRGIFTIYPIGDLHIDQRGFNRDRLKAYVNLIKKDPTGVAVFVGDAIEGHTPRHRHFNPDAIRHDFLAHMDEYVRYALDEASNLLFPITKAGRRLIIVEGNHDIFLDSVGFAPMLADRIRGDYLGGEGFVTVWSGKKGFRRRTVLYCTHGFGGGRKIGASVNNMRDYMQSFKADVYIAGHTHQGFTQIIPIIGANEQGTELVKRHLALVRTTSFIERAIPNVVTYAGRKGYPTSDETIVAIKIDPSEGKMRRIDLDL